MRLARFERAASARAFDWRSVRRRGAGPVEGAMSSDGLLGSHRVARLRDRGVASPDGRGSDDLRRRAGPSVDVVAFVI
jgi:hypothetical protein